MLSRFKTVVLFPFKSLNPRYLLYVYSNWSFKKIIFGSIYLWGVWLGLAILFILSAAAILFRQFVLQNQATIKTITGAFSEEIAEEVISPLEFTYIKAKEGRLTTDLNPQPYYFYLHLPSIVECIEEADNFTPNLVVKFDRFEEESPFAVMFIGCSNEGGVTSSVSWPYLWASSSYEEAVENYLFWNFLFEYDDPDPKTIRKYKEELLGIVIDTENDFGTLPEYGILGMGIGKWGIKIREQGEEDEVKTRTERYASNMEFEVTKQEIYTFFKEKLPKGVNQFIDRLEEGYPLNFWLYLIVLAAPLFTLLVMLMEFILPLLVALSAMIGALIFVIIQRFRYKEKNGGLFRQALKQAVGIIMYGLVISSLFSVILAIISAFIAGFDMEWAGKLLISSVDILLVYRSMGIITVGWFVTAIVLVFLRRRLLKGI